MVQCALGLLTIPFSAQHMDGSEMMKLVGWAQSVVTFRGAPLSIWTAWRSSSAFTGVGYDPVCAVPVLSPGAHLECAGGVPDAQISGCACSSLIRCINTTPHMRGFVPDPGFVRMPGGGCALPGLQNSLCSNRTLVEASYPSRMGEPWGIVLLDSAKESGSDGGGEGLLSASRFALRVVACGNAFATLESNLGRSFSSFPALKNHGALCFERVL